MLKTPLFVLAPKFFVIKRFLAWKIIEGVEYWTVLQKLTLFYTKKSAFF